MYKLVFTIRSKTSPLNLMRYNVTYWLNGKKDIYYDVRLFYLCMLNVKSHILGFIRCFRFRVCNIVIKETIVLDLDKTLLIH